MQKNLLWLFIILWLAGCSSGRKMSHAELMKDAPQWARQTPTHPAYFHGVGMAVKANTPDYRERARQNALSELAGNISVDISSTSVLNYFEFDHVQSDYFRDNIEMSTRQYLEGFELVDNWENDHQYWVYYRLSKAHYQQIKQERISRALSQSQSRFEQARDFAQNGNAAEAAAFYIRAFEDISDFLGEDLRTTIDGVEIPYTTTLMAELIGLLQNLTIHYPVKKLTIDPRAIAPLEPLVKDAQLRPVAGIPIKTTFSWRPGIQTDNISNTRGGFLIPLQDITPATRNPQISTVIDVNRLIRDNTSNHMVRNMLEIINVNPFVLPIRVMAPVFYISVEAHNLGESFSGQNIEDQFTRLLRQDGFQVSASSQAAEYTLHILASTTQGQERNHRFSSSLRVSFILKDQAGNTVFSKTEDSISGTGSSFSAAGEDAFRSLPGLIRIQIYPDMMKRVF